MSSLSPSSLVLRRRPTPSAALGLAVPIDLDAELKALAAAKGRDHIWDLSPNLHCSVIGTCLTTGELRQFFGKMNETDATTASDHALHGRAVRAAGQKDIAGKLLNKMLDRRHEVHVRRFAKAKTAEEVRGLWGEALERGDIPGAYWAVLTHPATDHELVQTAFGDVHMLSHLVGMSNRADIAQLRHLERELEARDEKIERQQARLQQAAAEKVELLRRVEQLEAEQRLRPDTEAAAMDDGAMAALSQRLADEQARSAALGMRVDEQGQALKAARSQIADLENQLAAQRADLGALETAVDEMIEAPVEATEADLNDVRLLYVGGRPKLIDQLRMLTSRRGGMLLSHDGGVEDKPSLLRGLISQADAVFFPVDCVSHYAAGQVKRLCREAQKPFVPLRSASLASFIAATANLDHTAPDLGLVA